MNIVIFLFFFNINNISKYFTFTNMKQIILFANHEVVVLVLFLLLLTIVNTIGVIIKAKIITPIKIIQQSFFLLFQSSISF